MPTARQSAGWRNRRPRVRPAHRPPPTGRLHRARGSRPRCDAVPCRCRCVPRSERATSWFVSCRDATVAHANSAPSRATARVYQSLHRTHRATAYGATIRLPRMLGCTATPRSRFPMHRSPRTGFLSAAICALMPLLAGAQTAPTPPQTAAATGEPNADQAALVREVAAATGKDPASLNALLDSAVVKQGIIDAITRPAEAKPWSAYRPIFMNPERIHE